MADNRGLRGLPRWQITEDHMVYQDGRQQRITWFTKMADSRGQRGLLRWLTTEDHTVYQDGRQQSLKTHRSY